MTTIITYATVAILSAVIGIFIYRNNTKVISKQADKLDAIWDEHELTDKIKELQEKLNEKLENKKGH